MPVVINHLYEFGEFRVHVGRGLLLRQAEAVPLTAKAFEILLVLIQHRNQTASKDVLLKTVWPDTFVEEANLTQHISMLRKALGEGPQDRRYIATVPGRGYRFVAEVREVANDEGHYEDLTEETIVVESHSQAQAQIVIEDSNNTGIRPASALWISQLNRTSWTIAATAGVVLLALSLLGLWNHLRTSNKLSERDLILLTDFENSTGEPVFDGPLKEGMAVELGQSPFLDVATRERVRETLRLMGRQPEEQVRPPLANELCERLRSKALISGSIARLGAVYVIAVEAVSCADGTALAREQMEAKSKEEVLPVLGGIASRLRAKLGESLTTIQKFNVPLERATTPSLDALKAYSLGLEQRTKAAEREAIPLFEHAIEFDPNFALAYAQLGAAYRNLGETERANDYFKKGFGLRANLSEREKLYVTGRYYEALGEIDKLLETYEIWTQMYPRDPQPFNNLSAFYQVVGQYERAAAAGRNALALDPNRYVTYANLANTYLAQNRLDDAKQVCQQARLARRESLYTHQVLFELAFLHDDQPAMQQEIDWARGTERENDMLTTEALALTASGKMALARPLFARSWAGSQNNGFSNDAAFSMAAEALAEADFGNYEKARAQATMALRIGRGIDAEEMAAEAFALSGDTARAQALVDDLHRRFPGHSPLNHGSLPSTLAAIELHRGNPVKAIEVLEQSAAYDFSEFSGLSPVYIRGLAYLNANRGREAAEQFQGILNHQGINVASQRHALSYLGLARARMMTNDIARARRAYSDFLSLWSDADRNIPILEEAEKEYEKIR